MGVSPLLQLQSLSFGYTAVRPLAQNLSIDLVPGELVCLAGPNGSGKSTLLRTLSGLQKPLSGLVLLAGKEMAEYGAKERARLLSVVFARFPSGTLLRGREFVALGRSPHTGWTDALTTADQACIDDALCLVDGLHLANALVDDLSDGERQRLSVARAVAQQAPVLLLDEPTAFLDLPHRIDLYNFLRNLARTRNMAVIMSSHELDLALRFADRLLLLDGKGNVACDWPEALVLSGELGRAFSSDGVRFEAETGSFTVAENTGSGVCCPDGGLVETWTRKALRRLGYTLLAEGYPRITVEYLSAHPVWKLEQGNGMVRTENDLAKICGWLQKNENENYGASREPA